MLPPDLYALLSFWFKNEEYWFNATEEQDKIIIEKFYKLLNINVEIDRECKYFEPTDYLAWILVYDQLVRHFYRGCNVPNVYHDIAYDLAQKIMNEKLDLSLDPEERIFVLLPFRHGTVKDREYSLAKIKEYREKDPNNSYYRRFYQANVRDLVKINNENFKESDLIAQNFSPKILDDFSSYKKNWLSGISSYFYTPNKPDFQMNNDNVLLRDMMKKFKSLPKKIVISLSGGVDSMVCSYILKHMGFDVIAVMIDYNNRDTSEEETNFVRWWCSQIKIKLYIRKITEINRVRDQDREFYEAITKEIRFNCYKQIGRPVVLGHNKDDSIENIFSNIKKMRSLDNLLGMEPYSIIKEVQIYRPVLSVFKADIYLLANELKIPFLYDSTPKWCERGRYRDQLIPFINNFDPEILEKLIEYSKNNKELNTTFNEIVKNSYESNIFDGKLVIDYNYNGYSFWKTVFKDQKIKVSNRAIQHLTERIANRSFGKIHLAKDLHGELKYSMLILN